MFEVQDEWCERDNNPLGLGAVESRPLGIVLDEPDDSSFKAEWRSHLVKPT
jgi:hypothetical protein